MGLEAASRHNIYICKGQNALQRVCPPIPMGSTGCDRNSQSSNSDASPDLHRMHTCDITLEIRPVRKCTVHTRQHKSQCSVTRKYYQAFFS